MTETSPPHTNLEISEIFWRDHQPWLQRCGYMLRPRYMPDWKPSWSGKKNVSEWDFEDGLPLRRGTIICDATRISDGTYVALKIVKASIHPYEIDIGAFFSSPSLAHNPRNHCVPILEVLKVPDDDDMVIIVMPLLRYWDSPPFETVGEVVEFLRQLLEGLQFMHMHHVAHRDVSEINVMMDGSMFPEGWHFVNYDSKRDEVTVDAKYYNRRQRPPKYFLIDFGISRRYDPKDGPPLEHPIMGGDKSVPEFQKSVEPCDPFATDIYYVGNLIRMYILREYRGMSFMRRLVAEMVQDDPAKRPTIDMVVTRFDTIRKNLWTLKLHSRAGRRDEWFGRVRDFAFFFKSIKHTILRVPPVPAR